MLNVQSINNKSSTINSLIADNSIDVLTLTETWHSRSSDLPLRHASPNAYVIVDAPRPGHSDTGVNHGGIAVIHRDVFSSRVISLSIRPTSFELLVCHMGTTLSKFILVTIYRPSSQQVTELFFEEITSLFEIIASYGSTTIISGDFNIHVDDANAVTAQRLLSLLDAFSLEQHISGPTHTCGHTLDLLITQPECVPDSVDIDPPIISDHSLITYYMSLPRPSPAVRRCKEIRRLNSIDWGLFVESVLRSPVCSDIGQLNNCTTTCLCELYHTELQRILDEMAPVSTVVVTEKPASPWFDGECRLSRRQTRAAERRYRRSHLPDDLLAWTKALEDKGALFRSKEKPTGLIRFSRAQATQDCYGAASTPY